MIGFLLYEGAELIFSIIKISYNTTSNLWNWYYNNDSEVTQLQNRIEMLENQIKEIRQDSAVDKPEYIDI